MKAKLLLLGSLGYLLLAGRQYALLPVFTAFTVWLAARKNTKWSSICCLVLNFGMLALFKLAGRLPLGISFYTFQAMGYVLDVRRGKSLPEKSFWKVLSFTIFFPQLIQGPISRFDSLAPQLEQPGSYDPAGWERIIWGAFKKLVIADRAAIAASALLRGSCGGAGFLLLSVVHALRIYGDFTGGIDMALGLSQLLGIRLAENFDDPFLSEGFPEYWRRWHMSLGLWMKDYVFYPLSVCKPMRRLGRWSREYLGKPGKKLPVYLASLATWLVTGLWHGVTPNFLLWGFANFLVILLTQELGWEKKGSRITRITLTFFAMNLVRLLDLYPNVGEYFANFGRIFTDFLPEGAFPWLGLSWADWVILLWAFGFALAKEHRRKALPAWARAALALITLIFGIYGIGFHRESFLYSGY